MGINHESQFPDQVDEPLNCTRLMQRGRDNCRLWCDVSDADGNTGFISVGKPGATRQTPAGALSVVPQTFFGTSNVKYDAQQSSSSSSSSSFNLSSISSSSSSFASLLFLLRRLL
ncbi:hypothetical protein E4U45_002138 [Claviceps purpurea]|nr:hypothetical protein E4U45_002138 [Claviceps purpurea]